MEDFELNIYCDNAIYNDEFVNNKFIFGHPSDIFAKNTKIKGNETILDFLKKYCVPPLGAEQICSIFAKYGYTQSHIYEGWCWDIEKLQNLTEVDFWKMIALSNIYWKCFYKNLKEY